MLRPAVISAAACLICLAGPLACGGDSTAPDGASGSTGATGSTGSTGSTGTTAPDYTVKINALLTEINSGENASSQSFSAGGVGLLAPTTQLRFGALASLVPEVRTTTVPAENATACLFDSTTVRFNCPAHLQANGITVTAYFQILDTAGKPQAHFDTLTTDGMRKVTDMTGTTNQPLQTQAGPVAATQTTNNHNDLVLLGVRAGNHKQNGTGTMQQTIVTQTQPEADITANTTTADFAFSPGKPYPTSGKLTAIVHTVQGTSTSTTTQVTTYDGTAIAKLVITFAQGGTRTCTYDMTSTAAAVCTTP